jgi:uncharacterized oxidoreductase
MDSIELDIADPASIRRVSAELISRYPKLNVLPLDEFLQETEEALATDADEIMVARAKFLRDQAGPNVSAFVNTFNERFELQPPEAEPVQETVSRS